MTDPASTMQAPRRTVRWRELQWLALAAFVFLAFLGRNAQLSSFEHRVVDTAAAMSRSGWPWSATLVDVPQVELQRAAAGSHLQTRSDGATWSVNPWLIPVFEGQIRLQKPPLPYWTVAVLFRLFGESPTIARLPSALLGVLTCVLIRSLARDVAGRRVANVSFAVAVSSLFVVDEFRKAMADSYLTCLTLAAIVAWVRASRGERRAPLVVLFYALLGLASLAKGPVAFIHVGVALAAFSFAMRRRPRVGWLWHAAGVAVYLLIALPWPVYIVTHLSSALEIWRFESVGEFSDNLRNARPFYFYLPNLVLIAAPWSAAWIVSGIDAWRRRVRRRRLFAWVWLVVIVAIFSCSHMKKNAYLQPVVPAIAIATAQVLVRTLAIARRKPRDAGIGWMAVAHWIAGVVFAGVISVATFKSVGGVLAVIVGLAALVFSLLPLRPLLRRDYARWFGLQAIAFALLILTFLAFPTAARRDRKAGEDASARHEVIQRSFSDEGPLALSGDVESARAHEILRR